jgi:hypothetical protein
MGIAALKYPSEAGARLPEQDSVWVEASDLPFKELRSIDVEKCAEMILSAEREDDPRDSGKSELDPRSGEVLWRNLRGGLALGEWSKQVKPFLATQELGFQPLRVPDLAALYFPSQGFSLRPDAPMKLGPFNWPLPRTVFGPSRPSPVTLTTRSANPEQIRILVPRASEHLGRKLTAYLADLGSVTAVDELSRGERSMSAESLERLRVAIRAADVVTQYNGRSAAQAWLQGKNRYLGRAPARYLRENGASKGGAEVLSAARAFIAGA